MVSDNGLRDFREHLAKLVLAALEGKVAGVSAHFGESYETGSDPEAIAYRAIGGAFRFLAFAFAPWRMWDLHVGVVAIDEKSLSIGYHISERAQPLLLGRLGELASLHGCDVIHQPKAVEFQANLPPVEVSNHNLTIVAGTVCGLCERFAKVAGEVPCPPSMRGA